jgi:hypothetical protein
MTVTSPVASPASAAAVSASAADTQEIPESVTAELEKLEQEGGAMVEVEGVGAILAELGDDKELLGKETCGFNIQFCESKDMMRIEFVVVVALKFIAFWDVMMCDLVHVCQLLRVKNATFIFMIFCL